MLAQACTIGLLILFCAMLPGPDFAMVTKNAVLHSRRAGIFTSLGIASGTLVHISYCMLGLALVISQSLLLFSIIKYIGAAYLIYLGITSLLSELPKQAIATPHQPTRPSKMRPLIAFRQGLVCNLFNPKATLFFLALFTVVIKPETPKLWELVYAAEIFLIVLAWFSTLTLLLSHPRVLRALNRVEKYISKILGIFLIGFGVMLAFVR
jgi:RhtB (resistance to homoserine/threonine) family protein